MVVLQHDKWPYFSGDSIVTVSSSYLSIMLVPLEWFIPLNIQRHKNLPYSNRSEPQCFKLNNVYIFLASECQSATSDSLWMRGIIIKTVR